MCLGKAIGKAIGHYGIEFTYKYTALTQPLNSNGKVMNQNVGFVVPGYSWSILSQLIHATIVANIQIFRETDACSSKRECISEVFSVQHVLLIDDK